MKKTIAVIVLFLGALHAQTDKRQAILDYQLTLPRANQLITAMEAMTKYVVSLPDYQERMRKAMKMTPPSNSCKSKRTRKRWTFSRRIS